MKHAAPILDFLAFLALLALTGCHYHYVREPDPVTETDIIRWSKENVAPDEIIQRIRDSRTVYLMDAEDVIKLNEQGVDRKVINYMLETQKRDLERRAQDHHHHCDPYWCPYHGPVRIGFGWGYWW